MDRFVILYLCLSRRCSFVRGAAAFVVPYSYCVCTLSHFLFLFFLLGDAKLERFCMLPKTSRIHLPLGISLRVFDRSYFSHGSLALQLQCSICDYFTLRGGGGREGKNSSLVLIIYLLISHVSAQGVGWVLQFFIPHILWRQG